MNDTQTPGNQRFMHPEDVETLVLDWGTLKWMSEVRVTGHNGIAAGLVVLEPAKGHERHNHPGSDEVLYFLSGEGEQMIEDDEGHPQVRHVRAGDMVFIPESVYHATQNTGWEPLRLLAVYAPGGPEALLRDLPECRIIPAGQPVVRR